MNIVFGMILLNCLGLQKQKKCKIQQSLGENFHNDFI